MEKRTLQKLGLLCASVALCSAASWWSGNHEAEQSVQKLTEQPVVEQVQEIKITVCVSGAVAKPGLYEVTKGSRAQQAIELAGGVTEEADMDRVNLAQLCKDGGHIKVPRLSKARIKKKMEEKKGQKAINNTAGLGRNDGSADTAEIVSGGKEASSNHRDTAMDDVPAIKKNKTISGEMKISLNSASETELTQLPGVGAATAKRIIRFRREHGFQAIEDVMKIPGIGPAKFAKMKACLVL